MHSKTMYQIYVHILFSSVALFKMFRAQGVGCIGTTRSKTSGFPATLKVRGSRCENISGIKSGLLSSTASIAYVRLIAGQFYCFQLYTRWAQTIQLFVWEEDQGSLQQMVGRLEAFWWKFNKRTSNIPYYWWIQSQYEWCWYCGSVIFKLLHPCGWKGNVATIAFLAFRYKCNKLIHNTPFSGWTRVVKGWCSQEI